MRARALSTIILFLLLLCSAAAAGAVTWSSEASCGYAGSVGDLTSRGIYITNYPGTNLSQVQLAYGAATGQSGFYSITLTAHRNRYDGPIIGTAQTITISLPDQPSETFGIFDFGGAPVSPGNAIYFTQSFQGIGVSGPIFFDVGMGSCPDVFETMDTTPPFSTPWRHTVGIFVTEHTPTTSCIASDTVMCVDNNPGDQRFQVTVSFHHGSFSGDGQEIPLAQLGVIHGGLFWFFGPDNPEMLFKMIHGCALNNRFWIFISAGTNVEFTVNVFDTATGHTATYHNPDNTAAVPIQDTSALPCP